MAESFEYDVFIAYASQDARCAKDIDSLLSISGNNVFLDSEKLIPGVDWAEEIARAQRDSLLTVVLVSNHSDEAYFQKEEIKRAIGLAREKRHRVVPVYLTGNSPADHPSLDIMQIQSIFLEKESSLLRVALKIEEAINFSRRREDWQSDIDSGTIVLVTGCHQRPELRDRPLAYQLQRAIDREGERRSLDFLWSVVMGDIWFLERSGYGDHPNIISIGSSVVNPLTQQIIEQGETVQADQRWRAVRGERRWALFGDQAEDTRAAVRWFQKNCLTAFLEEIWCK